jgi:hypothetical protein
MNSSEPFWNFTDFVPKGRREKMLTLTSFDEVIQQVTAGSVDCFEFEQHRNSEYRRIFFRLHVGKTAYDAFFNSPVGYRAQYCINIENGLKQNRRLIEAVTPLCLESIKKKGEHEHAREKVLASLSGTDAKVWINDRDWPDIDEIHINYAPWVTKAKKANEGTMAEQVARTNAAVGVLAPENIHLEIKGAWLTSDNREWRDPGKAQRAEEIRDYGTT